MILKIFYSICVWTGIATFLVLLREYGVEEIRPVAPLDFSAAMRTVLTGSVLWGTLFALVDIFFPAGALRKKSYGYIVVIKSAAFAAIFVVVSVLVNVQSYFLEGRPGGLRAILTEFFIDQKKNTLVIFLYVALATILLNFIQQVDKKFGPGVLFKIFAGKYHRPRETARIFMFIDLKSSTTCAENLGHIRYSELIQDCFDDLSDAIIRHKAEIYQYVGDEAVLTWSVEDGLENANCIGAFFSFTELIKSRAGYYQRKYGLVPEFKAGANIGVVTIAEVGKLKREIAYHGDAINTAARIQEKCGELDKSMLVSEMLVSALDHYAGLQTEMIGSLQLKGKKNPINIYAVEQAVLLKSAGERATFMTKLVQLMKCFIFSNERLLTPSFKRNMA